MERVDERRAWIGSQAPALGPIGKEGHAAARAVHDEETLLAGDFHGTIGDPPIWADEPRVVPGLLRRAIEGG